MQNENCKVQNDRNNISERPLEFGANIIKLVIRLSKTVVGRHIGFQVAKSATSSGANYEEACGAESRADFVHKMQVVLKELRESLYWLKLIKKSNLIPADDIQPVLNEADELVRIFAKSIVTAKNRKK